MLKSQQEHAEEFPNKLTMHKPTYSRVQTISFHRTILEWIGYALKAEEQVTDSHI